MFLFLQTFNMHSPGMQFEAILHCRTLNIKDKTIYEYAFKTKATEQ